MKSLRVLVAALSLALASGAFAQTKWDLPTAYPPTNFHTENITQFVADVDKATGGKLKITVHPNASLFKANEIKRAVQGNQAQAGEILLVNFENEDAFFGLDGVPFLATSYGDAMKLYKAEKKALEDKLAKQGIKLLYTVAWPPQGIYANRTLNSAADMRALRIYGSFARHRAFAHDGTVRSQHHPARTSHAKGHCRPGAFRCSLLLV